LKIAVIGCGYVGTAATTMWKALGHEVTATTTRPSRLNELAAIAGHAQLLIGNQPENWKALLDQHQVLLLSVAPSIHSNYSETYLDTAKTLQGLLQTNHSITQVLYIGSTSVYGSHDGAWVDEESPLYPNNDNAKILCQTEKTLLDCSTSARAISIFRLGEIYGPSREIRQRLQGQSLPGDGSAYTNLIHVEDIVRALDLAIDKQLRGIYNLCNDLHIPRKELYRLICQKHHLPEVTWNPAIPSPHAGNKRISNQKIKDQMFTFLHGNDYE
jgi:nucleoside-diphosphate-sugar epimerase